MNDNIITKLFLSTMIVTVIVGWDVAHSPKNDIIHVVRAEQAKQEADGLEAFLDDGRASKTIPVSSPDATTNNNSTRALETTTQSHNSLTKMDIAHYIVDVFGYGEDAAIALAVFQCESGLNPDATNEDNWLWGGKGIDRGIAQINDFYHKDKFEDVSQLYDPKTNIDLAKRIWESSGWTAWSCYKSEAYLKFLDY